MTYTTYYAEIDHNGYETRISWSGGAMVNIQYPVGGQWVDAECFTNYDITCLEDAVISAIEYMNIEEA